MCNHSTIPLQHISIPQGNEPPVWPTQTHTFFYEDDEDVIVAETKDALYHVAVIKEEPESCEGEAVVQKDDASDDAPVVKEETSQLTGKIKRGLVSIVVYLLNRVDGENRVNR